MSDWQAPPIKQLVLSHIMPGSVMKLGRGPRSDLKLRAHSKS